MQTRLNLLIQFRLFLQVICGIRTAFREAQRPSEIMGKNYPNGTEMAAAWPNKVELSYRMHVGAHGDRSSYSYLESRAEKLTTTGPAPYQCNEEFLPLYQSSPADLSSRLALIDQPLAATCYPTPEQRRVKPCRT
jgi:hypothetical protein